MTGMRRILVSIAAVAAAAAPLAAQQSTLSSKPSVFHVAPYVGYENFGDYRESRNGTELSNENATLFGAQAQLDLSRHFSLVGNFGYASTKWTLEGAGVGDSDLNLRDVGVWLYDANLQARVPLPYGVATGISPFVQVGAGAVRYTNDQNDISSPSSNNVAVNGGVGVDWQLGRVGLRLMAKDYVTSLDWTDAENISIRDKRAHNWAFSAGLKFGF
jgi:hypothetical protein